LDGDHVSITASRCPLRCKHVANADDHQPPPTPGGTHVQYIAPEYFGGTVGPWDGFAADLWACGLMLYSMVVGCDALFLAPVEDDRTFVKLCLKGQVKSLASKHGKLIGKAIDPSDELVDLLQKMLKVDPRERFSLQQILEHSWITNDDLMTPQEWEKQKQLDAKTSE
jgi:serine/threonine protein kinase